MAPAGVGTRMSWSVLVDEGEYVPELRWPASILTYDRMRNDPQVQATYSGITLPVRRRHWYLDPLEAPPDVVALLAEDTGLPVLGEAPAPRVRNQYRFNWDDHLRLALLSLLYGHMFFEQVGEVVEGKWRLRKLAPRLPQTISEMTVAEDGGLVSIRQGNSPDAPELEVGRLVAYVCDREGANWAGRSIFRAAYQPWLLKDGLLRIDVTRHDRTG